MRAHPHSVARLKTAPARDLRASSSARQAAPRATHLRAMGGALLLIYSRLPRVSKLIAITALILRCSARLGGGVEGGGGGRCWRGERCVQGGAKGRVQADVKGDVKGSVKGCVKGCVMGCKTGGVKGGER